jgi:hypothetical protein
MWPAVRDATFDFLESVPLPLEQQLFVSLQKRLARNFLKAYGPGAFRGLKEGKEGMRWLIFGIAIIFFSCSRALAEKRVALVIGNSHYVHAAELANPVNDASDMAAALGKLGFTVVDGYDLPKASLEKKVREFANELSGSDVGVFYYAGHGLQASGVNYIVPVDAELTTSEALDFEMVRLDVVQRAMERSTKTNIIFLDACRNNPLARNLSRALKTRGGDIGAGLAPAESGIGTLISFSTQPGNVAHDGSGHNSPFTGALVKRIAIPGEDILATLTAVRNDVLAETKEKQVPWENHALRAKFYFNPDRSAPPKIQTAAVSEEDLPFESAIKLNTRQAYEQYLKDNPNGLHVSNVKARLGTLELKSYETAKKANTTESFSQFLNTWPKGEFAALAKSHLASLQTNTPARPKSDPIDPPQHKENTQDLPGEIMYTNPLTDVPRRGRSDKNCIVFNGQRFCE